MFCMQFATGYIYIHVHVHVALRMDLWRTSITSTVRPPSPQLVMALYSDSSVVTVAGIEYRGRDQIC
eukprot:COSAG06_NODE_39732_length_409_cov_0.980645_1_plen_66_part_10